MEQPHKNIKEKSYWASFFAQYGMRSFIAFIVQIVVLIALCLAISWIAQNVIDNLKASGIATGFDFLDKRAGFKQPSSIIQYDDNATNKTVIFASLVNLAFISILCLITATILGLIIGVARLSKNWLIAKLALCYVEFFRNIPPLVLLFFWALGVMQILPSVRQSFSFGAIFINVRGIYLPAPIFAEYAFLAPIIALISISVGIFLYIYSHHLMKNDVQTRIKLWQTLVFFFVIPLLAIVVFAWPQSWNYPELKGFNYSGGYYISPEFISLYLALSIYTAALIAETFRSGMQAVSIGLKEAGSSLGLSDGLILRLITLPLAMRIIIPPLASQYMNLVKNTSLGAAVGYSELMMVSSTIIEKTGQSIELAVIWIVVYLGLSLLVSFFMNWFNRRMALVER